MVQSRPRARFSYRDDPSVPGFPDDRPLVIFDGTCVLCSGSARFLMDRDRQRRFRMTTAQSRLGQALYRHFGLDPDRFDTFVLVEDGRLRIKSDAALAIAAELGPPWRWAALLRAVPARLRDAAYDAVARNRFRLFGRRATCLVPSPADRDRFLA